MHHREAYLMGVRAGMRSGRDFSGWRSMDTAPRDGIYIELMCTWGVAPWYCIARWTTEDRCVGGEAFTQETPRWVTPQGGGPIHEGSLHWRPWEGDPARYTDPTMGAQDGQDYWQGALHGFQGR